MFTSLLQKLRRLGLSKPLFYVLVFLIPIQTRKVFLSGESFYYGFHSFYNTFYFYLTDIVIFSLIMAYLWENSKNFRVKADQIYITLGIFWLISAVSILVSPASSVGGRESGLSLWGLLKLSEFLLLFVYVRENISLSRESIRPILWIFIASMSLQALLGIVQYMGQGSLGLKLLGEEYFRPGMSNIAEFVSHGVASPWFYQFFPYLSPISEISVNLRAYGTFSHPNVFAGLLFTGLMAVLYLFFHVKNILSRESLVLTLGMFLIISGLIVTFSRFGIILAAFGALAWFLVIFVKIRNPKIRGMHSGANFHVKHSEYKPQNLALIIVVLLLAVGINYSLFRQQLYDRFVGVRQGRAASDVLESIGDRQLLANIAFKIIKAEPMLGVGLHNFVVRMQDFSQEKLMPYFYQPVHNIYLLIVAESGVPALIAFLVLLFLIIRAGIRAHAPPDLKYTLLIIFLGFLAIGMADHFPLTLQQGSLAFWLTAGLLAAKK